MDKGDPMTALEGEMKKMVDEERALKDKDHKNDDSDDNSDDSSEDGQPKHLFTSAIDVGSHFIDVMPSNELIFRTREGGHLMTEFKLTNPCKTAPTAFHVYTSSPIPVKIVPQSGFIPTTFQQTIKILWEADKQPNKERLENAMFFVKALPLSPETDIDDMTSKLEEVFNTYNINILFCTHHLPCTVAEEQFNPGQMQQMQQRQFAQQEQQMIAAGQRPPQQNQQMTPEKWASMTPEQQQAYKVQMAGQQQQQQQQPQMTQERWASMNPQQQNAYRMQQQQMQQQAQMQQQQQRPPQTNQ